MPALRPSVFNRIPRSRDQGEPFLELEDAADQESVNVYFAQVQIAGASAGNIRRSLLLNIHPERLTIWPINTRADKSDYLLPKYKTLTDIIIARPVIEPYPRPKATDDVNALLEALPEGVAKQFQFGLGLHWENRFICEAIAEIPGVTTLVIHGSAGREDTEIAPPEYMLGIDRFHEMRKQLARIAGRYQREALLDKRLLSYNMLLHGADQRQFPSKNKRLRPNSLSDMTEFGRAETKLSSRDRQAAVRLVSENAGELAKTDTQALLTLKGNIERVSLLELTKSFEGMLSRELTEPRWQGFFANNHFILSMAFSAPAIIIGENPYVGGTQFTKGGGKIADFLLATASTGNLSLIEIKTPSAPLLNRAPYRDNVFAPSAQLSGAVAQILDQRFKLQRELAILKENSGRHDVHAYAIQCVVVAGIVPTGDHEKKSLELYRNSLSDVAIVTFDELLGRLKEICALLSDTDTRRPEAPEEPPF